MLVALILFLTLGCEREQKTDKQLWQEVNSAIEKNSSNLSSPSIKSINNLLSHDNSKVKEAQVINCLVLTGANCLDSDANWTNKDKGRDVYDVLQRFSNDRVSDSLVRNVLNSEDRLKILFLGVKLGIDGSEKKLNSALMEHGDEYMAEDYLNSGSSKLYDGGQKWAKENGYSMITGPGSNRTEWGEF